MKNNNPYDFFPNFVLRSPILPLDFYHEVTKASLVSDDTLKRVCTDLIFRESLFLASPSLFNKMDKWLTEDLDDEKEFSRLKYSLLKYISRMSSRCTPFGLFAGCTIGKFTNDSNIKLNATTTFRRHTRLDMNYLVSLAQNLAKLPMIKSQLLFFPNSSIYEVGDQFRYVEYKYIENKRHHHIASVSNSEYLNKILTHAKNGATLENLAKLIVEVDITLEEATEFIYQLVDNQLLISELEPSVSGPEFLTQMIRILDRVNGVENILKTLNDIQNLCNKLDQTIGNDTSKYKKLTTLITSLETEFEDKYLLQTDLSINGKEVNLNKKIAYSLLRAMTFINKLSPARTDTNIDKFRQAFSKRYESREMPLSKVLDVEIGIGFLQSDYVDDPDPILDNLILPPAKNKIQEHEYKINSIHQRLHKIILDAVSKNDQIIILNEQDFDLPEPNWNDTPDTLSFMTELIMIDGKEKIKIIPSGGSSAANLLGRFCHGDQEILEHTKQIVEIEEKINNNKILAEIVHLPEARVGNVLMRPVFRKAEIPYLAKSVLPLEQQIDIEDLMISVRGNKIRLRSKRLNKEIIPRLSNAHNFVNNALPIYQFLASMQNQGLRASLFLNLGPFSEEFPFIPRIEYQNIILRPASWKITKSDLGQLLKKEKEDEGLLNAVQEFCTTLNIPKLVLLKDGDNELLINLKNLTSIRMWLNLVKNRTVFILDEFLFDQNGLVQGSDFESSHTNQFIISFYHKERLQKKKDKHENSKNLFHW